MRITHTGFPKNEGCTRNFLGGGNAATQAMNFIAIKFEQAKRAVTTERNDLIMANGSYKAIRPYYYGLGKEYGLDKNAIDNLVKYDEKSGQVSFGGKNRWLHLLYPLPNICSILDIFQ